MDKITIEVSDLSKVSDGFHTIQELYDHRIKLFMAFLKDHEELAWKSKIHSDGSSYEGWFIAGLSLPGIEKQITYHIPEDYWTECPGKELEKAPEWDGHTPNDVLSRLAEFINYVPKQNNKLCFIDVETTGTDPNSCSIIQLSGIIVDSDEEITFDYKIRPYKDCITEEALAVTGYTREEIMDFDDSESIYKTFLELLDEYIDKYDKTDKMLFIAYNANFDYQFVRKFFEFHGNPYFGSYFYFPPLDIMTIAYWELLRRGKKRPENFKLATVAKAFRVEVDEKKLHNSMYDIELTRKLYSQLYTP